MVQFISSLRCRLIVLVLLAVIPAFGVILHSAASHRDLTAEQVKKNALRAARAIAAEHERFFENAHQFLIVLARLPQIRENDKASCRKILAGLLEPVYADLGVADLKGNSICTALPAASSLISVKGKHQAHLIETHDFTAGTLRTDPSTGKTLLEIGYPVMDSPGAVRALVIGAMNFSWVTRLAVERHLYPGATYTLINNSGNVLLRYPETDDWKDEPIIAKTLLETLAPRDTEKSFEAAGADGIRRLFALSQLRNTLGGQTVYAVIDIPAVTAFEYGAGFAVARRDVDSGQPKDTVIDQQPKGGGSLARGGTVILYVSKVPKESTIPDVTSQDEASATAALEQSGFTVDVQEQDTTDPNQDGIVLSQDPPGNTRAKPGTTVTIVVGRLVPLE